MVVVATGRLLLCHSSDAPLATTAQAGDKHHEGALSLCLSLCPPTYLPTLNMPVLSVGQPASAPARMAKELSGEPVGVPDKRPRPPAAS